MSLKEEIEARMPDFVYAVKVDRDNIHGLESIHVVVNYIVHGTKMFLDMNFAKKNQMDAEHIAAVVNSYLPNLGK